MEQDEKGRSGTLLEFGSRRAAADAVELILDRLPGEMAVVVLPGRVIVRYAGTAADERLAYALAVRAHAQYPGRVKRAEAIPDVLRTAPPDADGAPRWEEAYYGEGARRFKGYSHRPRHRRRA